jgi:hypothetical protein
LSSAEREGPSQFEEIFVQAQRELQGLKQAAAKLPRIRKKSAKRNYQLDPDVYEKLIQIRAQRPKLWRSYGDILVDAVSQFLQRHGNKIPKKHLLSVSLPLIFALALRRGAQVFRTTETDLLNMAIRELDEKTALEHRKSWFRGESPVASQRYRNQNR